MTLICPLCSDIYDHCILQLADPDAPVANPTHFFSEATHGDRTHSSSESPPFTTNHTLPTSPLSPLSPSAHYNHTSHHTASSLHSPQTAVEGTNHNNTSIDKRYIIHVHTYIHTYIHVHLCIHVCTLQCIHMYNVLCTYMYVHNIRVFLTKYVYMIVRCHIYNTLYIHCNIACGVPYMYIHGTCV